LIHPICLIIRFASCLNLIRESLLNIKKRKKKEKLHEKYSELSPIAYVKLKENLTLKLDFQNISKKIEVEVNEQNYLMS
jgi:hypothetical protein